MKILLAEDDPNLGTLIQEFLTAKKYHVFLAQNGKIAFNSFLKEKWNLCILDVMMPVMDGFTLAREIRKQDKDVPIIFLTARTMKDDTLEGFKAGADDYVTKPFSMEELLMRIQAILKRTEKGKDEEDIHEYRIGKYYFNSIKNMLVFGEQTKKLTTRESELLKLLCEHKNDVLERNFALRSIWSDDNYQNARNMDVYIAKLRKYLSGDPTLEIMNVHGKGFSLIENTGN